MLKYRDYRGLFDGEKKWGRNLVWRNFFALDEQGLFDSFDALWGRFLSIVCRSMSTIDAFCRSIRRRSSIATVLGALFDALWRHFLSLSCTISEFWKKKKLIYTANFYCYIQGRNDRFVV